jgi:predicted permease
MRFYRNLVAKLSALPGVQVAAESSDIPWTGFDENTDFEIVGRPEDPNHLPEARYHFASPDYFRAIGTPLLSGRFFAPTDGPKTKTVALVNSALAERYFPSADAVGQQLNLWGIKGVEVIGVVGDVKDSPDAANTKPALYWDDWQFTQTSAGTADRVVVMQATSDLKSLARAARAEVLALDPDLPITDVKPMEEVAAHSISSARFTLLLVGSFGALAVILAAVGIFGLMTFNVSKRTHEIGIRVALGAQKRDVLEMVISQAAKTVGIGVAIGLVAAIALTRAMGGLLYGVNSFDVWTFAASALFLAGIALLACYSPAKRASQVDPMVALRYE